MPVVSELLEVRLEGLSPYHGLLLVEQTGFHHIHCAADGQREGFQMARNIVTPVADLLTVLLRILVGVAGDLLVP